ncbi:MAG TPA: alcohol dehydrogenase, partial [Dehalococcoidia bacterium]|nr:alcohol dehydrogenase [Dehalococcoidia bacterium]
VEQAFNMIRPGGLAVVVGVGQVGVNAEVPILAFLQEKKLVGSLYGSGQVHVDIPRLIDLYMDGKLMIDELISKVRPLAEVNEAFEDMKKGAVARSVLNVSA